MVEVDKEKRTVVNRHRTSAPGGYTLFQQQFVDAIADAVVKRVLAELLLHGEKRGRLMDVSEAGEYIGRTRQAVYHLVNQGKIPFKRQGSRLLFDRVALDNWICGLSDEQ